MADVKLKGIASYPKPFEKTASVTGGAMKYRCGILLSKNDKDHMKEFAKLKQELNRICQEKWKKNYDDMHFKADRSCIVDGDTYTNQKGELVESHVGHYIIRASSDDRPAVVDNKRATLTKEDGKLYGGAIINMIITPYPVSGGEKGGNGLFAGLGAIQVVGSGQRFGKAPIDPNSVFDEEEFEGDEDLLYDSNEEDDDI